MKTLVIDETKWNGQQVRQRHWPVRFNDGKGPNAEKRKRIKALLKEYGYRVVFKNAAQARRNVERQRK